MNNRFIVDNEALVNITVKQAYFRNSEEASLHCNYEKAYDRVNPTYLKGIIHKLRFSAGFINAIISLFYSTSLRLNINGHISQGYTLERDLKQGVPTNPSALQFGTRTSHPCYYSDTRIQGLVYPVQVIITFLRSMC